MGTPWLNPLRWLEWLTNLLGDDTPAGCKPLVPNTRLQLQRLEARLVPALTAVGDTASTALNTAVTIAVEANDTIPPGDTVFLSYFGGVSDGTVAVVGNDLVYTPDSGYYGVDHFGYELSDTLGAQSYAGVSVTVGAGSTLLAVADTASTPINTAVTIAVESNDTIPSGDSVTLNVGFGMTFARYGRRVGIIGRIYTPCRFLWHGYIRLYARRFLWAHHQCHRHRKCDSDPSGSGRYHLDRAQYCRHDRGGEQ